MARRRFSDLERVYDALKLAKVDIDTLPANLNIRKYADWKEGNGPERNITRPDLGDSLDVGIIAFGLPATNAASKIQVNWNSRADGALSPTKAGFALLGIEKTTLTDYNENPSFVPAKITFARKV